MAEQIIMALQNDIINTGAKKEDSMKKFFLNHSKITILIGILISTILVVTLSFQIFPMVHALEKNFYPEPDVRPNITENATWDSELGMYVSNDYKKNSSGNYELNADIFINDKDISIEEQWLLNHADSKDEIDMAIIYSVESAMKEAPTIFSAISPRNSDSILTAMSTLPVSSYPEVWKRLCTEPAYRSQKIVALENFLCLSFADLGLYDPWAQREWYNTFNELKKDLINSSFDIVSQAEIEKYGYLLLPILMEKTKSDKLSESELKLFTELVHENEEWVRMKNVSSIGSLEDIIKWYDMGGKDIMDSVIQILNNDYVWVE